MLHSSLSFVLVVAAFLMPVGSSLLFLYIVVGFLVDVAVCSHICLCRIVWAFFFSSSNHRVESKCCGGLVLVLRSCTHVELDATTACLIVVIPRSFPLVVLFPLSCHCSWWLFLSLTLLFVPTFVCAVSFGHSSFLRFITE